MSDKSSILTLAGQIAEAITSEPLESERLKTIASVVRVLRESISSESALEVIAWLCVDLTGIAQRLAVTEAEEQAEHERLSRTSARYRRDFSEGTL